MASKNCLICWGQVSSDTAWVELSGLPGRFWLCPSHQEKASFVSLDWGNYLYMQEHKPGRIFVGRYPYDEGSLFVREDVLSNG